MADTDILSQDEIDALLGGMNDGEVTTDTAVAPHESDVHVYDFTSQDRIVRGRMPTLEMLNERFARNFRVSLFNLLRRPPEIAVGNVQLLKFSEYIQGLFMPAHVNLVKLKPLRGTSLFTFDPKLIFTIVDNYFGGDGRYHATTEGRDPTPTELRVVELVLDRVFADMGEAWSPVLALKFEHRGCEANPHLANIASPSEVVVVTVFSVELEGGGGEFHIALPYAMVEPIRELLDTGVQSDRGEQDDRWLTSLREEIEAAELDVLATLTEKQVLLRELMRFQPGDIVPIEHPENVVATVEDVPVLRARFGVANGAMALKVIEVIKSRQRSLSVINQE